MRSPTYAEQIAALREGGVDLLMIETIFDTLNAKAAVAAARDVAPDLPLWLSVTITDLSGRTLSNAGLPNSFGGYDEEPRDTAHYLREFAAEGMVNVVGGCCGTTPAHIAAIAEAVRGASRAVPRTSTGATRLSGLEPFEITPDTGFVMIGERTNVTGSAKFRRLIEADDYTAAVNVALDQVRNGANLLDVNMDADLLESEQAITTFLNLLATEPEAARIPVMVDSSKWSVLEAGLKCVQGKGVVNSISLADSNTRNAVVTTSAAPRGGRSGSRPEAVVLAVRAGSCPGGGQATG